MSSRVAESDLLVYVNVNYIPMDGGHKSVHTPLAVLFHPPPPQPEDARAHPLAHGPAQLRDARLHRPDGKDLRREREGLPHRDDPQQRFLPGRLRFHGQAREQEWNPLTRTNFLANHGATRSMPRPAARKVFQSIKAPHRMTSVQAGATDPVHAETLKHTYRQQLVPVEGQSDVLLLGVPYLGPYNVNSIMNPLLVMNMLLGYLFNLYKGNRWWQAHRHPPHARGVPRDTLTHRT